MRAKPEEADGMYTVREPSEAYRDEFAHENELLSVNLTHFPWKLELTLRATSGGRGRFDGSRARLGTS